MQKSFLNPKLQVEIGKQSIFNQGPAASQVLITLVNLILIAYLYSYPKYLTPNKFSMHILALKSSKVCKNRNKCLTAKLLKQGYRYHKLRKAFSKFYRRHYELISKFNVGLKSLLHQSLSESEFYGDLVYKFKKIRVIVCLFEFNDAPTLMGH